MNGSPVINPINGSQVITGADDGQLHCLAIASGERCGGYPSCGCMDTEPAVDATTSTLFFTCYIPGSDPSAHADGMIASLDVATGKLRWTLDHAVGAPIFSNGTSTLPFLDLFVGEYK